MELNVKTVSHRSSEYQPLTIRVLNVRRVNKGSLRTMPDTCRPEGGDDNVS
jgi:hypothetical protein